MRLETQQTKVFSVWTAATTVKFSQLARWYALCQWHTAPRLGSQLLLEHLGGIVSGPNTHEPAMLVATITFGDIYNRTALM